jgi:hypothetical protein
MWLFVTRLLTALYCPRACCSIKRPIYQECQKKENKIERYHNHHVDDRWRMGLETAPRAKRRRNAVPRRSGQFALTIVPRRVVAHGRNGQPTQ